jgi:hypothetical protein
MKEPLITGFLALACLSTLAGIAALSDKFQPRTAMFLRYAAGGAFGGLSGVLLYPAFGVVEAVYLKLLSRFLSGTVSAKAATSIMSFMASYGFFGAVVLAAVGAGTSVVWIITRNPSNSTDAADN